MNAVADEKIGETMLYAELWRSFASVVQAYAALAGGTVEVTAAEQEMILSAGPARLKLRLDLPSGAGNWQLRSGEDVTGQGRLEMLPEGRIAVDGKAIDLDHAAIDLVALVTSTGSAGKER